MGRVGEICKQIKDAVINITGELNYKEGKKESEVKTKALIIYCINKFTGMNGIKISEMLGIDKSVVNYHLNRLNKGLDYDKVASAIFSKVEKDLTEQIVGRK